MERHDFYDFMGDLKEAILKEYAHIRKRAAEDPGTAGDQGEENWARLLRGWLPANYPIVTKGRLVFPDGSASPQVDLLVLQPSYPVQLRNQKHYFSGGVVAAFECKLTLKKEHIKSAFRTGADIKRRSFNSRIKGERDPVSPYDELVQFPLYGVLSHSHVWKSEWPSMTIRDKVAEFEGEFAEHPRELIDLICVADTCTIVLSKALEIGPGVQKDIRKDLQEVGMSGAISCMYTVTDEKVHDSSQRPVKGDILAGLIFSLVSWLAMEDVSLRSWADHLAMLGVYGGIGKPLFWAPELLSQRSLRRSSEAR